MYGELTGLRRAISALGVVAIATSMGVATNASAAPPQSSGFDVEVLSGRADTVSGADALVAINIPRTVPAHKVQVLLNGSNVRSSFKPDTSGRLVGLVAGLDEGDNELVVGANGRGRGRPSPESLVLTNHSMNGPVFSGPQQSPFICQTEAFGLGPAVDEFCNAPTSVEYMYRTTAGDFAPLPGGDLPVDLATTTTTDGHAVNYIVRVERGTINRAVYEIAMLHDPTAPLPTPWTDVPTWNRRLVYTYGGGCDAGFRQGSRSGGVMNDGFLSRGYAVASSSQNVFGNNCNDLISAETTMMVKEHFIEDFGAPAHTIGYGCSGGSMQVQLIAQNYPGILDGIVAMCAYPDLQSIIAPVSDCALLFRAFDEGSSDYTAAQKSAITGFASNGTIETCSRWALFFSQLWIAPTPCPGVIPTELWYDAATNPDGVRCTFFDNNVNAYGVDPDTGYARRPLDNVGVQYGLEALNDGVISFEQFVEINELVGGFDSDGQLTPDRTVSDLDAISITHATGKINVGAGGLAEIPILDVRGYTDLAIDIHDRVRSLSIRERLIEANGNADNHVIWTVPRAFGITGGRHSVEAVYLVDEWLTHVSQDSSATTPAEKLAANRPADAVDSCWAENGTRVVERATIADDAVCNQLYRVHLDPRLVSGAPLSNDVTKCALKTVDPGDYSFELTSDQMTQLEATFPDGTCDYAQPGLGSVPFDGPWLFF